MQSKHGIEKGENDGRQDVIFPLEQGNDDASSGGERFRNGVERKGARGTGEKRVVEIVSGQKRGDSGKRGGLISNQKSHTLDKSTGGRRQGKKREREILQAKWRCKEEANGQGGGLRIREKKKRQREKKTKLRVKNMGR